MVLMNSQEYLRTFDANLIENSSMRRISMEDKKNSATIIVEFHFILFFCLCSVCTLHNFPFPLFFFFSPSLRSTHSHSHRSDASSLEGWKEGNFQNGSCREEVEFASQFLLFSHFFFCFYNFNQMKKLWKFCNFAFPP